MTNPPDAPLPHSGWHDEYEKAERAISGNDLPLPTSWWSYAARLVTLLITLSALTLAYKWY